jgi:hypothetical protein
VKSIEPTWLEATLFKFWLGNEVWSRAMSCKAWPWVIVGPVEDDVGVEFLPQQFQIGVEFGNGFGILLESVNFLL